MHETLPTTWVFPLSLLQRHRRKKIFIFVKRLTIVGASRFLRMNSANCGGEKDGEARSKIDEPTCVTTHIPLPLFWQAHVSETKGHVCGLQRTDLTTTGSRKNARERTGECDNG
jgi:hypothetical protein